MKLSETKVGGVVTVKQMELPLATMMRLKALGMTNGTMVKVLNKKKSGSLILSVRGTRLALGSRITEAILVGGVQ
ncbi:MAG: ferrous iron transport protein A [Lachnospiraceae bacterium]|nr:ferrous iron transport protein A [Lachnospiraceae bacterium]